MPNETANASMNGEQYVTMDKRSAQIKKWDGDSTPAETQQGFKTGDFSLGSGIVSRAEQRYANLTNDTAGTRKLERSDVSP